MGTAPLEHQLNLGTSNMASAAELYPETQAE
ncbi:hypothetical protein PE36_19095 [Moritella sp. PE36]|nr:hypothetical protein PE36_19095 [Moritella sp. PE36]